LRNPCTQIDGLEAGLMEATLDRDADGNLIRKSGIMSVVIAGGVVNAGDEIRAVLPVEPHVAMEPV
jgi:MOSC domain-containing protein YiiM